MTDTKDTDRMHREEFKQVKGFLRSSFKDPTMTNNDWSLVDKGVKQFQKISKDRSEEDIILITKNLKDNFNLSNSQTNKNPVRIVYSLLLAMTVIPDGKGGDKDYNWFINDIIKSINKEKNINHYDAIAITKAGKEYNETLEMSTNRQSIYKTLIKYKA